MTETMKPETPTLGGRGGPHVGELNLRRFHIGEALGGDQALVEAHIADCAECHRRLDHLGDEQRAFEERISFDRFAAGVERAVRVPARAVAPRWWARPASTRSFLTVMSVGAVAAVLALVVGSRPLFETARLREAERTAVAGTNRIKGGERAAAVFRIAAPQNGPQRFAVAEAPEPLASGDRIRVGVRPGTHRFLFAASIDDQGTVTALYPEGGSSLPVPPGSALHYLPDSLELTGRGSERLIVLLTDSPLDVDAVRVASTAAFNRAGRNLSRMPDLAVAGEQFHRTFLKP
jgi:hypothetical protein